MASDPLAADDRQSLTDVFKEEGVGAGLTRIGSMFTPAAPATGQLSLADTVRQFMEFSPAGDVKDLRAGVTGQQDGITLDWAERGLALFAGLGIGAVAVTSGTRLARQLQHKTELEFHPSMVKGDGTFAVEPVTQAKERGDRQGFVSNVEREWVPVLMYPTFKLLDPTISNTEQLANVYNEMTATDLTGSVNRWELDALGQRVIDRVGDGRFGVSGPDGSPAPVEVQRTQAAQFALTIWENLNRLEQSGDVRVYRGRLPQTMGRESIEMMAALAAKAMRLQLGPDFNPTPQMRLGAVDLSSTGDISDRTVRMIMEMPGELLPTERIVDRRTGQVLNEKALETRIKAVDPRTMLGEYAANVDAALERAANDLEAATFERGLAWYYRFNDTVRSVAGAVDLDSTTTAAVFSTLSPRTKWAPDNLVGGTHLIVQVKRPDLDPASGEYKQLIAEALAAGRWAEDLHAGMSAKDRQRVPLEEVYEWYADVNNIRTSAGDKLRGATLDRNVESAMLLLNLGINPSVVLRMMKTHDFGYLGADPANPQAVAVDVHTANATQGAMLPIEPQSSKGVRNLRPGETYIHPSTGAHIRPEDLEATRATLAEEFGEAEADRMMERLSKVPSEAAAERYEVERLAHRIVGELHGISASQVQSSTWESIRRLRTAIQNEVKAANRQGRPIRWEDLDVVQDWSVLDHYEGVPQIHGGVIAQTARASTDTTVAVPDHAAGDTPGILLEPLLDGTTAIWGPPNRPEIQDALRHLYPVMRKGHKDLAQFVPRTPHRVRSVASHVNKIRSLPASDGGPSSAEYRVWQDVDGVGFHPARAGNVFVFDVESNGMGDLLQVIDGLRFPYAYHTVKNTSVSRPAVVSEKITAKALRDVDIDLHHQTRSPVVTHDWVILPSAVSRPRGSFKVEGPDGPGWLVFGMSYSKALSLAKSAGADHVVARRGQLNTDGTVSEGATVTVNAAHEAGYALTIDGVTVRFTVEYDLSDAVDLDSPDDLAIGQNDRRVTQIVVPLGGETAPLKNNLTDDLWDAVSRHPSVVSAAAYVHGGNWRPDGTRPIAEHVFTDPTGAVATVRTASTEDVGPNGFVAYVPEAEALGLGTRPPETLTVRRTRKQVEALMTVTDESIFVDDDVIVHYPPDATIRKRGSILNVVGEHAALLDLRGDVPTVQVGVEMPPDPGLVEVDIQTDGAVELIVSGVEDVLPARVAFDAMGVPVKGVRTLMDDARYEVTPAEGRMVNYDEKVELTRTDADVAFKEKFEEKTGVRLDDVALGLMDDRGREAVYGTVESLLGFDDRAKTFTDRFGAVPADVYAPGLYGLPDYKGEYGKVSRAYPRFAPPGIILNERHFRAGGLQRSDRKTYEQLVSHPEWSDAETTVIHETAHLIWRFFDDNEIAYPVDIEQEFQQRGYAGSRRISAYATVNAYEWWAELFTRAVTGQELNHLDAVVVRDIMDALADNATRY